MLAYAVQDGESSWEQIDIQIGVRFIKGSAAREPLPDDSSSHRDAAYRRRQADAAKERRRKARERAQWEEQADQKRERDEAAAAVAQVDAAIASDERKRAQRQSFTEKAKQVGTGRVPVGSRCSGWATSRAM